MITCLRQWPTDVLNKEASGGEWGFLNHLPHGTSHQWYVSGRAALYNTLLQFGFGLGSAVMMPAYIAAGVIDPVRRLGLEIHFYHTHNDLLLNEQALIDQLDRKNNVRAVIVLHPMGRIQAIDRLAEQCRSRNVILIEDCAQGFFTRDANAEPKGSRGEVAFFSLPKYVGTINGAVVVLRDRQVNSETMRHQRPLSLRVAGLWYQAHLYANHALHRSSNKLGSDVL